MTRFATFLLTVLLIVKTFDIEPGLFAHGQPPEGDSSSVADDPRATLTIAPAGTRRNVPGRWATLAVNGLNKTDADVVETATVIIGDETNQQFARRLWIPARARRQSWLQVQIPGDLLHDQRQIEMTSFQLRESESGEQFQSNVVGRSRSQRSLLLSWEPSRTAVFFDQLEPYAETYDLINELTEIVHAARDSAVRPSQDLGLVGLGKGFLPPSAKALDAVDQVVIASDLVLSDTVAVTRLRTWLQSGGRVWIMVDQISPEAVRALLGDAACYSIIDRVELSDFSIQQAARHASAQPSESENWTSETPVELVRVLVDTADVHSRIDGWPAAFWKRVGHGEVLFTTLGRRGWTRDRRPLFALQTLSSRFFVNRIEPPLQTKHMVSFLDDEIGYTIPSRALVSTILGLHVLVVLLAGAWLAHRRSLQQLAIVVPLAALIATASLVAIGNQQTSAVPSTIATGQIARVIPESSEVQVDSVAAIYSQVGRRLEIESSPETTTLLRDEGLSGQMRRILWDDRGDSNWLFVTQPPGVIRHVDSESKVTLPRPWNVHGRFSERGFEGRISGLDADQCEDPVIVAVASPALAVDLKRNSRGAFFSDSGDVLSPGQFIDDKLMSDVQQHRQALIRKLISSGTPLCDSEPSMLVWTDPIKSGVKFSGNYVRRGSTLVSIPIRLERLPSGTDFQIPASFIRIEAVNSTVFNTETGRWLDQMNKPNESELRCVLPKVLLPCKLNRAILLIKINAPSRTLEIKCMAGDKFVMVHRKQNPTGLLRFEIDQAGALQLDADGGLPLSISISASPEEREAANQPNGPGNQKTPSRSTWGIDYIHVTLEGTAL